MHIPNDAKATGALAMTLHAYQRYDAAAQAYSRAHLLEPQTFDWLYLLGAVQMKQGAFDTAVRSFQTALKIRPEDLPARLRLAECLTAVANWDESGTDLPSDSRSASRSASGLVRPRSRAIC